MRHRKLIGPQVQKLRNQRGWSQIAGWDVYAMASRRPGKGARRFGTTQTEPGFAVFSITSLPRAHHPQHTMNHLKRSLRAVDDPRTIKEENGVPAFASVFSLHKTTRNGREEVLPITVKASRELALTLVNEVRRACLRRGGTACLLQESRNKLANLLDLGRNFFVGFSSASNFWESKREYA